MTSLRQYRVSMERELRHARYTQAFAQARVRQPALADVADIATLISTLKDDRAETFRQREDIVSALLSEYALGQRRFSSAALLVAFYPSLGRVRARLTCPEIFPEERDHIIVYSFLEAVAAVAASGRHHPAVVRLRRLAGRRIFRHIQRVRAVNEPPDTATAECENAKPCWQTELAPDLEAMATRLLFILEERRSSRDAALLRETRLGQQTSQEFASSASSGESISCVNQRRARATRVLRQILRDSSLARGTPWGVT